MALLGKKSGKQSSNTDVPPELKPYYDGSGAAAARRSALRVVLGLLILAILVTGGLAAWRYTRNHKVDLAFNRPKSNSSQSSQAPKNSTQNQQSNGKPKTNSGSSTNQGQLPSDTTAPSTSQSQTNQNNPAPATAPSQSSSESGASGTGGSTLTNTGPGETMAIVAIAAAALGTLLYYRRLLHDGR